MGDKRDLIKLLKERGFTLIRQSKHQIWSNGERKICVPNGKIAERTLKAIFLQVEGKGPFYNKREEQI